MLIVRFLIFRWKEQIGKLHLVTPWSVAKHAHHGPDFGLDPTKYGMTQPDLDSIALNGLINHINQGGMPTMSRNYKSVGKLLQNIRMFRTVEFNLLWGKIVTFLSITAQEFLSHLTRRVGKVSLVIS